MLEQPVLPRHFEVEVINPIAAKGSTTTGRRRDGSVYVRHASPDLQAYEGAIEAAFLRLRGGLQDGPGGRSAWPPPYVVQVVFYFTRPKRGSAWPVRLDIDKCTRAVLDALTNAGVIEDDRHVISVCATKDYVEPRDDMEDWRGRPWGSVDQTFVGVYPWRKSRPPRWEAFAWSASPVAGDGVSNGLDAVSREAA